MSDFTVKLNNVRLSFDQLFDAKAFQGEGEKKFSASFLLTRDHPNVPEVQASIRDAAKEKWGKDAEKILANLAQGDKLALRNGDLKDYDGYEGMLYIRASSTRRPLIIDVDKSALSAEDGRPYSGCYVNAIISLWAQDNQFGKRINAQLMGVQFLRDGESFGGGRIASADEFDEVEGAEDAGTTVGAGSNDFAGIL